MAEEDFRTPTRAFSDGMAGAETVEHRPTPAAAFARAREIIRAGNRVDMAALAADIGISRATLYRWTGDRERLIADAVWAELSMLLDHYDRTTTGTGAEHITNAAFEYLDGLAKNLALRAFLANEGNGGLELVTAHRGGVRPRLVAAVGDVIAREANAGYQPPDDPYLLADGIVALAERWLYNGGDPALNPDPATARRVIGLLLREG
jgi:AcrR family transcriptional regulator